MANVVSLSGKPVEAQDGKVVVPEIVARLEGLLEQAKRGDIRAMAIALVRPGYTTSTLFECGDEPLSHELMAAITYLQHRYAAHKVETSDAADTA